MDSLRMVRVLKRFGLQDLARIWNKGPEVKALRKEVVRSGKKVEGGCM